MIKRFENKFNICDWLNYKFLCYRFSFSKDDKIQETMIVTYLILLKF